MEDTDFGIRTTYRNCLMSSKKMQTRSRGRNCNSNIRVVVRIRPENKLEQCEKYQSVTEAISDHMLVFDPKTQNKNDFLLEKRTDGTQRRFKDLKYAFDHVFTPAASNEDIFEGTTNTIISDVLSGFNCTVFAYGATGSGKTHTMLGNEKEPGVIYHTMINLYEQINALREEKNVSVAVSYLEIYNEMIRDLLMPRENLPIREDKSVGVVVTGLSLHKPENADELLSMLRYGNENRTQHPTDANAESSRSHAVFLVYVKQRPRNSSTNGEISIAKMCLVDLAGSERASKNRNCGARFREGANINRSLLALGNVINALADKRSKGFIPYRDSKLTRLLKDSLGGNCQTIMIATVSPSNRSYEDTYNTLRYADRAKLITADLKKNIMNIGDHIANYKKYVSDLEKENQELRKAKKHLEEHSESARSEIVTPLIMKYQSRLEDLFKTRKTFLKSWINAEVTKRELKWKMSRKERAVRRIERLTGSKDGVARHGRIIERMKRLYAKEEMNLVKSTEQLKKQDDAIYKLCSEMQALHLSGKLGSEFLNMNMQVHGTKSLLLDSETYLGFVKRMARAQERQSTVNERVILSLIKVVKKQQDILQRQGMSNKELDAEFQQCCYMVEEKGVSWTQQNSGKKDKSGADFGPDSKPFLETDEDFSISEIIDIQMPKINCETLQITAGIKPVMHADSGAQRILKQQFMKPPSRSPEEKPKERLREGHAPCDLPKKPTATMILDKGEPYLPRVKKEQTEPAQRNTNFSREVTEKHPVLPSVREVESECAGLVKKLVDKYSQRFVEASQSPYATTVLESRVSPGSSPKPKTPLARRQLHWKEEEAKISVISSFPPDSPNTVGEGQCDSNKDSIASDTLNTTFEIDKPAIPNTPCIDDARVKRTRRSTLVTQSQDRESAGFRSKRISFSRKQLPACRLNFAPNECASTGASKPVTRSEEEQPPSHHLRPRRLLTSPLTQRTLGNDTDVVKTRKRPLSTEESPLSSKCKSSLLSGSASQSNISPSRISSNPLRFQRQSQSSPQLVNVNQSCANSASSDESCPIDILSSPSLNEMDQPCLCSTPENNLSRVPKEDVKAADYRINPFMQHVISSLKKHGKPSLTATFLPSMYPSNQKISDTADEYCRRPLKFLDVNTTTTSAKTNEKSNPAATSSSSNTHEPASSKGDLNLLQARLDRLRERRHFRSLASKPYSKDAGNRKNRYRPGVIGKAESEKDVQDISKPSYMLPTFAASQKMNGLEQSRPIRFPSRRTNSLRALPWNKP